MKNLLLMSIVLLASSICLSQVEKVNVKNDLQIANQLLLTKSNEVEDVLKSYDIDYWITFKNEKKIVLYVSYDSSVRLWELKIADVWRDVQGITKVVASSVVTEVFVRYRHSNLNDLRDFHKYSQPENKESVQYEKKFGEKLSHLRVTQL